MCRYMEKYEIGGEEEAEGEESEGSRAAGSVFILSLYSEVRTISSTPQNGGV